MISTLETFLVTGVFSFLICFVRMGAAFMILPGFGDRFISTRIRIIMALGMSFVLFPAVMSHIPVQVPSGVLLLSVIAMEFIVGLLIGTVGRIFMSAMDVAGMMVSMQSGLGNAQLFNPSLASRGTLLGGFFGITASVLLFSTNMHHLLITAIVESYDLFPYASIPNTGSMAQIIAGAVSASFEIGVKMAAPFFVITLLMYVGLGVLARLMPQVQVIMVAMPLQLGVTFVTLTFVMSAMFLYWLAQFEKGIVFFLSQAGG